MLQGFIIGVFIMSMFATIGILLMDNGHDHAILFCGPVTWIVAVIAYCSIKFNHWITYHNVRSLLICPDDKIRYIKDQLADTMRECKDRVYEFPNFNDHPEWNVNDWDKKFVWCNIGNVRYVPKKVWKQYGPISKEEIKYAKNNPWVEEDNHA